MVQTKNVQGHGKDQRVSSRAKHLAKYYLGQEYWDPTYMFLIFKFHSYAAERAFKSEMHFLRAAASWAGVMEAFTLPMIQSTMCFCSMRRSTFAVSTWRRLQ